MNEIVKVIEKNGNQVVSARDLPEKLGVGRDFSTWIREKIDKYGFIEGKDFSPDRGKSTGGRPGIEYFLTLSTAKNLQWLKITKRDGRFANILLRSKKHGIALK